MDGILLVNFIDFVVDFVISVILVALYLAVYTFATTHNEFELIRRNVVSAALSLGLSLIGFALPLSSAIVNTTTVLALVLWGIIALVVQIIVYWLVRILVPNLTERIAKGEIAAACLLGAASLSAGIVNAACMNF